MFKLKMDLCLEIFISRDAAFLIRWEYLKQDSSNIFKQFPI